MCALVTGPGLVSPARCWQGATERCSNRYGGVDGDECHENGDCAFAAGSRRRTPRASPVPSPRPSARSSGWGVPWDRSNDASGAWPAEHWRGTAKSTSDRCMHPHGRRTLPLHLMKKLLGMALSCTKLYPLSAGCMSCLDC